jgi:hypothetical protein
VSVGVAVAVSGLAATFTVTGATPPVTWGWGDGSPAQNDADLTGSHTYPRPGLYTAQLRAPEGVLPVLVGVGGVAVSGPWIDRLEPASALLSDADLTLHVHGRNFAAGCVIVWNGGDEPTTVVGPTELTTGVQPSTATGPRSVWVQVRNAQGVLSNAVPFQFPNYPVSAMPSPIPVMAPIVAVVYTADTTVRYINSVAKATSTPGLTADISFVLVDQAPPGPTVPTNPDWLAAHSLTPQLGDTVLWRGDDGMGNVLDVSYINSMYHAYPDGWTAADFAATGPQSEVFQPLRPNAGGTAYEPDPNGTPYTFAWSVVATPPVVTAFDPSEHTVAEVQAYADEHPDEVADILAAEQAGKDRSTLVADLSSRVS